MSWSSPRLRSLRIVLVVALAAASQLVLIPQPVAARPGLVRYVHTDPAEELRITSGPVRASSGTETQTAQAGTPVCANTHSRGFQLIYARPLDQTSRLASLQDAFLSDAASAQNRVEGQAPSAPKRPRFFCGISDVQTGRLSAAYGSDPLPLLMDDLAAKGYNRTDRKYVVWWDGGMHPFACGEGTFVNDEQPGQGNGNNAGPDFAVVYKPQAGGGVFCGWPTVLHEMGHTLGAVMNGAPNATGGWHCRDENDVMCYEDGPGVTTFTACPGSTQHFDCNGDDYFNPAPAQGSYLATHWNTYNSVWLESVAAQPPAAPDTSITSGPSGSGNGTSATFAFTSTAGGSMFTCSLDGTPGTACVSPKSYTGLSSGSHMFSVFATASGVSDATPATRSWSVAATGGGSAPETVLSVTPASPTNQPGASFQFSSTTPGATFTCALDGGSSQSCSSPAEYSGLSDGSHTFVVTASSGGVPDPTPESFSWTIDTVAPQVSLTAPTAAIQLSRAFPIYWAVSDSSPVPTQRILMSKASTAQSFGWYSVWAQQASPGVTFTGASGWTYCFVIEAIDAAGNRSTSPARCTAVPVDDRWISSSRFSKRFVSGFFDNTGSVASSSGATLTLSNVRARRIDMRVQMCRACRYIDVYWNGRRIKQMSLYTTDPRMISVSLASFASMQVGTLKLVVTSPVIVVDSIGVSQA